MGKENGSARAAQKASVRHHPIPTRRLITIESTDPYWSDKPLSISATAFVGAIVRVQPPANASDIVISHLRDLLKVMGAEVVRFNSRASADVVPTVRAPEHKARAKAREVVMMMAEHAPLFPSELKVILDLELTKVGL
jgi:hypothetical protein